MFTIKSRLCCACFLLPLFWHRSNRKPIRVICVNIMNLSSFCWNSCCDTIVPIYRVLQNLYTFALKLGSLTTILKWLNFVYFSYLKYYQRKKKNFFLSILLFCEQFSKNLRTDFFLPFRKISTIFFSLWNFVFSLLFLLWTFHFRPKEFWLWETIYLCENKLICIL